MKKATVFLFFILLLSISAFSSDGNDLKSDTTVSVKTGFNFTPIPVVAYDRDIGFKYGGLVYFYDYGDGSRYPLYDHQWYIEWSRTTKGGGINQFTYDSDKLIPGIRTAAEISYLTEKGLDFYGFNGYRSKLDLNFSDDEHDRYISRMFYRQERKMLRLRADFSGDLKKDNFKWFAGIEFYNVNMDTVDIDKLNEGQSDADKLPYIGGGLYGLYSNQWGIIPQDEINGGSHTLLKAGFIYDTRDNEPNPMKGIWTEAILVGAPSFLSNRDLSYVKLSITHRQYFTIIPKNLNFAYRVSYQGKIFGDIPSYMLPFVLNSPPNYTRDGVGGSKTVRGVLRNRIAGDGIVYANTELRWKFVHFTFLKQNWYLALSTFLDAGMVVQKYDFAEPNFTDIPINGKIYSYEDFFPDTNETLHIGYGAGLHIAINENTIVAVDYGLTFRPEDDGTKAPYIGLNFLF